ncbi:hypothetical protein MTBBW1_390002 [Desulfamplus magnetovallimortis]|uniref:Uncharacterized protein n=1 Tax=Desulfamplus magnetovallimortis TaxID=1246637 RepID=A0A1W1HGF3_9BACT|nr:hypothetical protein MTBBW1_390002 [Desulfamplus magnetovallimortis]
MEDPSVAYSLICALDTPDRRCGLILMSRYHNPLELRVQLSQVKLDWALRDCYTYSKLIFARFLLFFLTSAFFSPSCNSTLLS